jgi:hypothetical protein
MSTRFSVFNTTTCWTHYLREFYRLPLFSGQNVGIFCLTFYEKMHLKSIFFGQERILLFFQSLSLRAQKRHYLIIYKTAQAT